MTLRDMTNTGQGGEAGCLPWKAFCRFVILRRLAIAGPGGNIRSGLVACVQSPRIDYFGTAHPFDTGIAA